MAWLTEGGAVALKESIQTHLRSASNYVVVLTCASKFEVYEWS